MSSNPINPNQDPENKRCMVIALSAKNKLSFINGHIPKPSNDDSCYQPWIRCNDMITTWILFNLDTQIAKSLHDISQVWDELSAVNPLPYCTCQKCTCDLTKRVLTQQQDQRLMQFMMKLNDNLSSVRGNILMMSPLPNISQAYRLFTQEETHKELSHSNTESMAFQANRSQASDSRNFANRWNSRQDSGGNRWNSGSNSFNNNNNSKNRFNNQNKRPASSYYCTRCKIPGHSYERCFEVHGFPPFFKDFKDKKIAATVQGDIGDTSRADSNKDIPTYEQ
ncbi:uncharacterized protein LOC130798922 [Amaranthus tricolor]|uniref:uncharacterized protein LOC130798922 n=1 Tax=Amaranthus tricolor TaxID=29722 RepID=UPI00258EA80A|nr:uncharacterized protein LOC130798922 [Amaranthus tricolor]